MFSVKPTKPKAPQSILSGWRDRAVHFFFFANYFVGILAVALSIETAFQLNITLASPSFYLLMFCTTVLYYTFAYTAPLSPTVSANPRIQWYQTHRVYIRYSQRVLITIALVSAIAIANTNLDRLRHLPFQFWWPVLLMLMAALFYYQLLPGVAEKPYNLRQTGSLKPLIIGLVWAGCVTLLPVIMNWIENDADKPYPALFFWYFVKNWMFCTVNAIIFDMKDYADDANKHLKTVVVRLGLRKTIFWILIPLLMLGLFSFVLFAAYLDFGLLRILLNIIPFVALLIVAYSMHKRKNILYYLIIIDGLLLLKAACGITGVWLDG